MDDFAGAETADVRTWSSRIARALRTGGGHAAALLVKRAAPAYAMADRFDLLQKWIARIPEELITNDPQLLYWSGTCQVLAHPADAHPRFQRAFQLLSAQPTTPWTLLAWAGLVDAIFLWYRDLRELDPLFAWMTPEREALLPDMLKVQQSLVVASALFALAFRAPQHPRMALWRERGERLIEANPTSTLGAKITAALLLDYTWRGNLVAAEILEQRFTARASRATPSPFVSVMGHLNRATLRLHQGQLDECVGAATLGLAASARLGVRVWDSILHCHAAAASLSRGALVDADTHLAAIEQLFAEGIAIDEAYYRAVLVWRALISNDYVGLRSRADSALLLADHKGVPYFMASCRVVNGLALALAGHAGEGRALIKHGLAIGREIENPLVAWIGGLFLAHVEYASGNDVEGDQALQSALSIGRDHGLLHFFCFPREVIRKLIDRGLAHGYASDYLARLIALHGFAPDETPTRSDAWAFAVRIYTLGDPRVVHANGRVEPLSAQFAKQIDLLSVLIARQRPVPLSAVAREMYGSDGIDPAGSVKRVLHSLRARLGQDAIGQHDAALAFNFRNVWVDTCSLEHLRSTVKDAEEIEAWLDRHYHQHFMERVEGSVVVERLRRRVRELAERAIGEIVAARRGAEDHAALARLEARWQHLFPVLFALPGDHSRQPE